MAITFVTATNLTFTKDATWQDVDVSAYIPATASGVYIEFVETLGLSEQDVGARKNGSTDTHIGALRRAGHQGMCVGVDGNQVFEAYAESSTVDIYLVGYFESGASFFTNAVTQTPSTGGVFEDFDISSDTGGDTAIAACAGLSMPGGVTSISSALRVNGSSDDLYKGTYGGGNRIVGCDESEIFECKESATTYDWYVNGYFTDGVTFASSATEVTPVTTGSYVDMSALNASAIAGIYYCQTTGGGNIKYWNVRKNGSTEDRYGRTGNHIGFLVSECDASQIVEVKVEDANPDVYLLGYFTEVSSATRRVMVVY